MSNKKLLPKLIASKIIYSLIISCFASIVVSMSSLFVFSFSNFIILFLVIIFLIWNLETGKYLFYYFIKTIKSLFFFLPLAAIFYSMAYTTAVSQVSSGDELTNAAVTAGSAMGGFVVIIICLIIGLVGGLIIGTFAKEPKEEQNEGRSIGILFIIMIGMIIYGLQQTSEIEKVFESTDSGSGIILEQDVVE